MFRFAAGVIVLSLGICAPCIAATDATTIIKAQRDYFARLDSLEFKSTQTIQVDPLLEMKISNRTDHPPKFPISISQTFRFQDHRFYFLEQIPAQHPYNTNASFYDGTTYTRYLADMRSITLMPANISYNDPIGTKNPFMLLFAWAQRRPYEFSYRSLHDESYWDGPFDIVSVRDSETSPGHTILGINLPSEGRRLYSEATFSHDLQLYPVAVTIWDATTSSVLEEVKLLEAGKLNTGHESIPYPVSVSFQKHLISSPQQHRFDLYDMKINQSLSSGQFSSAPPPEGYMANGPIQLTSPEPAVLKERMEWLQKAQQADAAYYNKPQAPAEPTTNTVPTTGTPANDILEKASSLADAESKNLFILCTRSNSGWCMLFDRLHVMPEVKAILDKYYVIARIEIDTMPDGSEVYRTFGDPSPPAWVIANSSNKPLFTSVCGWHDNVGFPTMSHEIQHYGKALEATSAITQSELDIVTSGIKALTPYYEPDKVRAMNLNVCKDDIRTSTLAKDLLTSALIAARSESKNIFLLTGFPECFWCKRFDKYHATPEVERIISKYYIIRKIDTENMSDGKAVFKKYAEPGAPAWVILDPTEKVLGTSYDDNDDNVGFPSAPAESEHYVKALKHTSAISESEIKTLVENLTKTTSSTLTSQASQ